MDTQELISALADGQLQGEALARGVQAAAGPQGQATWNSYCVIGEVLRTGRATPPVSAGDAFMVRLQAALQQERALEPVPAALPSRTSRQAAANDWRWKLVAGVASVAAVTAVGWNMWGSTGTGTAQPQLAAAPQGAIPVAADTRAPAMMIRDQRLDQLLQAHRQLASGNALQQPSGFLRNATFEGPAR